MPQLLTGWSEHGETDVYASVGTQTFDNKNGVL
jgi:hypothetical protein